MRIIGPNCLGAFAERGDCSAQTRIVNVPDQPATPASLNPAEMIIAAFTPAAQHSPTMPGTVSAGVTITARSALSGVSSILAYALTPRTLDRLGLIGKTVPPNGRNQVPENGSSGASRFFGRADHRTVRGLKNASSDRSAVTISCAGSVRAPSGLTIRSYRSGPLRFR